jgi:hypothetical protein
MMAWERDVELQRPWGMRAIFTNRELADLGPSGVLIVDRWQSVP